MDTIDVINYSKDLDYDYNIKLFLLILILIYSIYGVFIMKINDEDDYWLVFFKFAMFRLPAYVFLYFYWMLLIFLYRNVSAETLIIFIGTLFGIYSIVLFLSALAFGSNFLLKLFGVEMPKFKEMKRVSKQIKFVK